VNERWKQIDTIVGQAMERSRGDRNSFINEACSGDDSLQQEVAAIVNACESAGDFLEQPALADCFEGAGASPTLAEVPIPASVGGYRIQRVLGVGGMGVVYLAEQSRPRRTVALKVIRPGFVTPSVLRRFEHEADVLGRLQHSGIAQIYEVGSADIGGGFQPFFAMECIEGESITAFAEMKGLTLRERVNLLALVCDAVHHAHQKGVIHRDLKPANILINAIGQPKVLDFGIARFTDSNATPVTLQTSAGQLIGTLAYMSPEQTFGDPAGIDTRCDIYSLGVVVFEVLTGRLPIEVSKQSIHEGVRSVREDMPARLSTMDRTLRGDLETIVAKSLEKSPDRRYQSAAEMSADLRRFLADEPIIARPPSAWYQLRKFSRRHTRVVSISAISLLLLISATVALTISGHRLRAANEAKTEALSSSQALSEFLSSVIEQAEPKRLGADATLVDALEQAGQRIDLQFGDRPMLATSMHERLGYLAMSTERFALARTHFDRAADCATDPERRIALKFNSLLAQESFGAIDELDSLFGNLLTTATDTCGTDHALTSRIRLHIAHRHALSEDIASANDVLTPLVGTADPSKRAELAFIQVQNAISAGNVESAEQLARVALREATESLGENHERVVSLLQALGHALTLRQVEEAAYRPENARTLALEIATLADQRVRIAELLRGVDSCSLMNELEELARAVVLVGDFERAEHVLVRAQGIVDRCTPASSPERIKVAWDLMKLRFQRKAVDLQQSRTFVEQATDQHLAEEWALTLQCELADLLIGAGDVGDAERVLRRVLQLASAQSRSTESALSSLRKLLLNQERFDEIVPVAERSWKLKAETYGQDSRQALRAEQMYWQFVLDALETKLIEKASSSETSHDFTQSRLDLANDPVAIKAHQALHLLLDRFRQAHSTHSADGVSLLLAVGGSCGNVAHDIEETRLCREAFEAARAIAGVNSPLTLNAARRYAMSLNGYGHDAIDAARIAVEVAFAVDPNDVMSDVDIYLRRLRIFALSVINQRNAHEALGKLQEAFEYIKSIKGEDTFLQHSCAEAMLRAISADGSYLEAIQFADYMIAARRDQTDVGRASLAAALAGRAEVLRDARNLDEAEKCAAEAWSLAKASISPGESELYSIGLEYLYSLKAMNRGDEWQSFGKSLLTLAAGNLGKEHVYYRLIQQVVSVEPPVGDPRP